MTYSSYRTFLSKSLLNYEVKKASLENIRILPLFLFSSTYIVIASFDFRPKSGADDRILQISLDGTQGIRHVKAKVMLLWTFDLASALTIVCAALRGHGGSELGQREHLRVHQLYGGHRQPPEEEVLQVRI